MRELSVQVQYLFCTGMNFRDPVLQSQEVEARIAALPPEARVRDEDIAAIAFWRRHKMSLCDKDYDRAAAE